MIFIKTKFYKYKIHFNFLFIKKNLNTIIINLLFKLMLFIILK